jgi:very-short-patch-repair endonuclease
MSWPGKNVVVELDGWEFHQSRASFEHDRAKWADLTGKGYRVIAVTHRRLTREGPEVAATLRSLLG